jgi:hypothetical protein
MKIRLTKRFARLLDGIDVSRAKAGEVLDLSERDAALLILEGWAAPVDADGELAHQPDAGLPEQKTENRGRQSRKQMRRTQRSPRRA